MSLAVVSGAARGIGRAIAKRLGADGATVLLVDLAEGVSATAGELRSGGVDAHPVRADLADPRGIRSVVDAVRDREEPLGVLVNNAGITKDALLVKMSEEEFLDVLDVNLGAAYELTQALVPLFADAGSVVNMSSRAHLGNVGQFNYAASKGGLVGLTRALALELAPRVRVNAVAPSLTATEMTLAMPEHIRDRMVASIPAGRMGEPAEIADVVAFLAGDASSYVTGQVVVACGGRSL